MEITTIGLDLAKNVFQVHGVNGAGEVVVRKRLRRAQVLRFFERLDPCLVGIEACGTSHYWAREIGKLGHEVRLMPPAYVKPYVKRGKTDASDAEAICEAVTRPTMRYVAIKSCEQQAALTVHRTRDLLVKQRTQLVNMIRGLLAEFGIEIRRGITHALSLAERIAAGEMPDIPALAAKMIASLAGQVLDLQTRLRGDRRLQIVSAATGHGHSLPAELDFSAEDFSKMSDSQRVRLCRLLAARARQIAVLSSLEHRANYLRIASEWDKLATDIEQQD